MAHIKVTKNEATHLILLSFGLNSDYRSDHDICTSPHTMEITDGPESKLEKSTGQGQQ